MINNKFDGQQVWATTVLGAGLGAHQHALQLLKNTFLKQKFIPKYPEKCFKIRKKNWKNTNPRWPPAAGGSALLLSRRRL